MIDVVCVLSCFATSKGTNMPVVRVEDLQTRLCYVVYVSVILFWDFWARAWKPLEEACLCHLFEA